MNAVLPSPIQQRSHALAGRVGMPSLGRIAVIAIAIALALCSALQLLENASPYIVHHLVAGSLTREFLIGTFGYVVFWLGAFELL